MSVCLVDLIGRGGVWEEDTEDRLGGCGRGAAWDSQAIDEACMGVP